MVRREGEKNLFLLLHYPSGHWDFPKGHVEKGETEKQTLRREIMEETGISMLEVIPRFKRFVFYFYQAKRKERAERIESGRSTNVAKIVVYYLTKTDEKSISISDEHVNFKWMEQDEALRRITFPQSKKVLLAAIKKLAG